MKDPSAGFDGRLIQHVDEAFKGGGWHGPSLRFVLKELSPEAALWTPNKRVHSAWSLALHCGYWKDRVASMGRRFRGSFRGRGANFPSLPARPDERAWIDDLALLQASHDRLIEALTIPPRVPSAEDIRQAYGAAAHDLYHAGQVRLLTRMREAEQG